MAEPRPHALGFRLFFATAMSITAIPVLGRIFMELGLSHTRTAALTIGAAAIDDVVGWLLLGVVSTIVTTQFAPGPFALRVLLLGVYLAVVFLVVRRPLKRSIAARIATMDVRVPVLLAIGGSDPLFCKGPPPQGPYGTDCSSVERFLAIEGPRLGSRVPSLEGYILPGAGHNLNVMPNAREWFAVATEWLNRKVAPRRQG
ncbi:cation:proton antiporter [Sorangium sp. So ce1182]|uniref:cation:proton antiporter n=1 Tax=Sorangium sp. So ce1182 TaxID=3133334 RepID=UPI003F5FBB35